MCTVYHDTVAGAGLGEDVVDVSRIALPVVSAARRVLCAFGIGACLLSAMLCGGSAASATVGTARSLASPSPMGPLRRFAANPRYFTANGKTAVYLTGAHTWAELVDRGSTSPPRRFDYVGVLNKLRSWHPNFIRL